MYTKASLALLLLLVAPAQLSGARIKASKDEEDETGFTEEDETEEGPEVNDAEEESWNDVNEAVTDEAPVEEGPAVESFLGDGQGIELLGDDDEGTTIFRADESSEIVVEKNTENQNTDVKSVWEIRTKLKFTSNRETLRNPELVERIVEDIKEQQSASEEGLNFVLCLHVGTTQVDRILETRPGFMEGRVASVKEALQPGGEIPGVTGTIAAEFMHFQSTRFAGLIMWAYSGETAPECSKDDMKPPEK